MPREVEYYLCWDLFELYDIFEFYGTNEGDYEVTEDPYVQEVLPKPGIYQIYGRHPIHGPESLLYIGRSTEERRGVLGRLEVHLKNPNSEIYLQEEQDVRFRVGRVLGGRKSNKYDEEISQEALIHIENLIIWVSNPIYNSRSTQYVNLKENVKIYDSGDFGAIPGEISTYYHRWDTEDD